METPEIVNIDGGVLEGGGQILRISITLSAIKGIPIRVFNIRAGRSKPGLRPQHLEGLKLVRDICGGKLTCGEVGSTEIFFNPGPIRGGEFRADPQTAGSIALLMQVALPVALFADSQVTLNLRGGTNADMAPPIDYMQTIFKPLMEKFGAKMSIDINMRGYYPRGGGQVTVQVSPLARGGCLRAVQMLTRGPVLRVWGAAFVAGALPIKVAHVMAGRAREVIHQKLQGAGTSIGLDVTAIKEPPGKAVATGSGINLFAETGEKCLLGASGIGSPKILPENVAEKAASDLIEQLDRRACVDTYAQDQVFKSKRIPTIGLKRAAEEYLSEFDRIGKLRHGRMDGKRRRGRPRKRWMQDLEEDIKAMRIERWWEKVQNRGEWTGVLREAKAHTRL